jgi:Holliday junction resolvase RusA-like endonuclease
MRELWIPGEPFGKERPRARVMGRTARLYTPATTRKAEERIASLWKHEPFEAGVPLRVCVWAAHARPTSHLLKDGSLSAAGRRMPEVTKRPDIDNVTKLVLDGLNGVAWHDDAQIVQVYAAQVWADREPGVTVQVLAVSDALVSVSTP